MGNLSIPYFKAENPENILVETTCTSGHHGSANHATTQSSLFASELALALALALAL
jgi:hypothetical protein